MKPSDFFDSLGLRFPAMPRLKPAGGGAPLQFSATGGGGGGYDDDPDDDFYDEYEEEDSAPRPRAEEARQPTAARRRTVQSEPDDRYWTDYLRIALPVIGLLLVIAVFWFWAQQLIDDPEDDLTPTETPGLAEVIESPTQAVTQEQPQEVVATPPEQQQAPPQSTQAPVVTPTPVTADQAGDQDAAETEATEAPAVEEEAAGGIAPDAVVATTDQVNLRSGPTVAEENVVTVLDAGTELTVLSGPTEAEEYTWWEVVDNATGDQGWVAEDFIEPAG